MPPSVGASSPTSTLMAVDFPAPFAPITATRLTCETVRLTFWMVDTLCVRLHRLLTWTSRGLGDEQKYICSGMPRARDKLGRE